MATKNTKNIIQTNPKKEEEETQKNYMNTSEIKAAKKLKLIKNTNQNIKYLINRKLYIYI